MNAVEHPLNWWAYGGYPRVMQELGCTKTVARHKVHQKIDHYYKRTGDPLWQPVGNRGHGQLRRTIMENRALDNKLM